MIWLWYCLLSFVIPFSNNLGPPLTHVLMFNGYFCPYVWITNIQFFYFQLIINCHVEKLSQLACRSWLRIKKNNVIHISHKYFSNIINDLESHVECFNNWVIPRICMRIYSILKIKIRVYFFSIIFLFKIPPM